MLSITTGASPFGPVSSAASESFIALVPRRAGSTCVGMGLVAAGRRRLDRRLVTGNIHEHGYVGGGWDRCVPDAAFGEGTTERCGVDARAVGMCAYVAVAVFPVPRT